MKQDCRNRPIGHRHDVRSDLESVQVADEHEHIAIGRIGEPAEALNQPMWGAIRPKRDQRMAVGGESLQIDVRDRPDLAVAKQVRVVRPVPWVGDPNR